MNFKLLQLAKMVMNFNSLKSDKGELIFDGELGLDIEVTMEDADGNFVAAPDGDYTLEDGRVIVVKDGKVAEIKEKPVEEETVEEVKAEEQTPTEETEPEKDEKDLKIEELEGLLKDRDAIIEELTQRIKELETKNAEPVDDPIEVKASIQEKEESANGALKYFR